MVKETILEEEVENGISIGIPREKLIEAGASPLNFADYLILNGKLYELNRWKKEEIDGQIKMTPTHYRQRNRPLPQDSV